MAEAVKWWDSYYDYWETKEREVKPMRTYYLGIDSGFSGAIVVLSKDMVDDRIKIQALFDMPILKMEKGQRIHLAKIRAYIQEYPIAFATLEKAQTMPAERKVNGKTIRQGISSTGKYMQAYGEIYGFLTGLNIPVNEVHPATWKRAMMKDMERGKESSIIRVQQLYPTITLSRKKDHGIADAILIGLYGINNF